MSSSRAAVSLSLSLPWVCSGRAAEHSATRFSLARYVRKDIASSAVIN